MASLLLGNVDFHRVSNELKIGYCGGVIIASEFFYKGINALFMEAWGEKIPHGLPEVALNIISLGSGLCFGLTSLMFYKDAFEEETTVEKIYMAVVTLSPFLVYLGVNTFVENWKELIPTKMIVNGTMSLMLGLVLTDCIFSHLLPPADDDTDNID